jgi:CubicO group peptidase (beta-lactamase class C family)
LNRGQLDQYHGGVILPNQNNGPVLSPAFAPVKELLEQQIGDGLHPGAQLCVEHGGEIVADFAVGEAENGAGKPLTHNSVMPLFSSAKPITAVAIGVLVDSGRLNFDDPVATHVPEFASQGKSNIQLRHLLNHTSGLADDALADGGSDRAEVIARLGDSLAIPGWVPGERAAYLPTSGWHMLGEVIERASGTSFGSFVQSFVLEPLQMSDTYPVVDPAAAEQLGPRLGVMHNTRQRDSAAMMTDPGLHARTSGPVRSAGQQLSRASSRHGEAVLNVAGRRGVTERRTDHC